jgi:hypothetical protein
MKHYNLSEPAPELGVGWAVLRDSATMRMLAAMDGYRSAGRMNYMQEQHAAPRRLSAFAQPDRESDRTYFSRRAAQQRRAAERARSAEARQAHRELAELYARRAAEGVRSMSPTRALPPPASQQSRRQDALLDAGLEETFPASDPVSVVVIH